MELDDRVEVLNNRLMVRYFVQLSTSPVALSVFPWQFGQLVEALVFCATSTHVHLYQWPGVCRCCRRCWTCCGITATMRTPRGSNGAPLLCRLPSFASKYSRRQDSAHLGAGGDEWVPEGLGENQWQRLQTLSAPQLHLRAAQLGSQDRDRAHCGSPHHCHLSVRGSRDAGHWEGGAPPGPPLAAASAPRRRAFPMPGTPSFVSAGPWITSMVASPAKGTIRLPCHGPD